MGPDPQAPSGYIRPKLELDDASIIQRRRLVYAPGEPIENKQLVGFVLQKGRTQARRNPALKESNRPRASLYSL
jgi:hypothetical protein